MQLAALEINSANCRRIPMSAKDIDETGQDLHEVLLDLEIQLAALEINSFNCRRIQMSPKDIDEIRQDLHEVLLGIRLMERIPEAREHASAIASLITDILARLQDHEDKWIISEKTP
jgi:hypothetical protein